MTADIADAVSARAAIQLTPGRHALVASQLRARFDAAEATIFGPLVDELEREARGAVALSRARRDEARTYSEAARDADAAVDATLATVDALLGGYERSHAPDTDVGRAARALRAKLLPRGLVGIVHAAFPDQLAQVTALLEESRAPAVSESMRLVPGLSALLDELAPRAARLREALDREPRGGASYRDVVAATTRAEARLAELVAGISFHHRGDGAAAVERRRFLLEPYATQVNAVRDRFRRRVPPTDVDPETGSEVELGASATA